MNVWIKSSLLIVWTSMFLISCNSTKNTTEDVEDVEYLEEITTEEIEKPVESYNYVEEEIENSVLNIPVDLKVSDLEKLLNKEIEKALETNSTFEQDGLKVEAEKLDNIKIGLEGQRVLYQMPLQLKIEKDLGFGRIKADASIALDFFTDYEIDEAWSLTTKSELERYEWIEVPRLKLGPVNIPAKFVGDLIIDRSKELISTTIDDQLKENFDLKATMNTAWKQMHDPIEISPEYNTWLSLHPQQITMTPINSADNAIQFTISVQSKPQIDIGESPKVDRLTALPAFSFQEVKEDNFQVFLLADIPYDQAESLAVQSVKGEEYSSGKYMVKVEDLSLYGQDEKLVVETTLSGSYKGNVYLTGEPFYNNLRNKVDIKDLKFTLNTKNVLLKTAGWLLKSNLRKQIRENVNFLIDYNLDEIRKEARKQLERYELAPGIVLKGNLDDLSITDVYLTPRGIRVKLGLEGQVNVGMEVVEELIEEK